MSHLAVPGEDDAYTEVQILRLARVLDAMRSAGIDPGIVHVSASGGILAGAARFADAVRPGLALYGLVPAWAADRDPGLRAGAQPSRRGRCASSTCRPGRRSATASASAPRADTRIATLGIGYGDGWPRAHANNGWVLVRGRRAPIVGADQHGRPDRRCGRNRMV